MSAAGSVVAVPAVVLVPVRAVGQVGSGTVVRRSGRNIIPANDQAYIGIVVTQNVVHLLLCPFAVILAGFVLVMRNDQCTGLHQCVVSRTAPTVHNVILVLVCVDYAVNAAGSITPVAGDLRIDDRSTQRSVCVAIILCPVVCTAGILAVFRQVIFLLGCQIHPASCP